MKDVNKRENQKQHEFFFFSKNQDSEMGEKKVQKTLHKTSQKEDWDQPQPWYFVTLTMSISQWPIGGARVLKKKIT